MTDAPHPHSSGAGPRSFAARVATVLLLVSLFAALVVTLWMAAEVLLLFFAGILLAVLLRAASDPVSRWTGIGPHWSLSMVIVILLGAMVGIGWMAAPTVSEQFGNLRDNLGGSVEDMTERLEELPAGEEVSSRAQAVRDSLTEREGMWDRVAGIFSTTFGALSGLAIFLVVGLFMAYSPHLHIRGVMRLVPLDKRHRSCEVITALGTTLQGWLVGQIISMLFLFLTTWIMLSLLGVPLAFILSLLTGLFTFVPYVGPLLALVPILLVAFVEDPMLALYTGALFMVIQNVEGSVLMPLIFQKTISLPPVLTIGGQLILGGIFGVLGFILATPLTAVALVLAQKLYVEDVLGDSMDNDVEEMPQLPAKKKARAPD